MNITIDHLNMTYPTGKQALRDINLTLTSPSMIGLLGPNGAGKSTLMKLLVAGLLPTGGTISVDGTALTKYEKQMKADLGYLPQHFGLYDELTVWQFLDYMAALKGIKSSKAAIDRTIEATDLTEKRKARIRTLSGGQRQRVGIAQALLGTPQFLIFDEPTVGLDPEERIRFRNLFSETAQDKLVLLSTHIIEDVQSVCNQLIVIDQGKILFTGAPEELILQAQGHVGTFMEQQGDLENPDLHITSRVNTARGVLCRGVAEQLPVVAQEVEPTLEDAYLFLITKEGVTR
ncbi:ABC transporter ATP-binding protein [Oscillospiraceae bacterium PP1C4]